MSTTLNAVPRTETAERLYQGLAALPASSRLSEAQLEALYGLGHSHLLQGQPRQALPYFSLLGMYGMPRRHYLAGLALCLQRCERYDDAVRVYALLGTLFPETADPFVGMAECLLAAGRRQEAAQELDRVLRYLEADARQGGADAEQARIRAHVQALRALAVQDGSP
ncbi:tetratricopeptide repeat protein [Orrella sp. JC864]|uniref:tetratricopeptide repeat protein n=1 Tax=Orrella sp. JC864 TaxID=3120298 RepID=UPI00300BF112